MTNESKQIKTSLSLDKNTVTFHIPGGVAPLTFAMHKLSGPCREEAAVYGMTVRLLRLAALPAGSSWEEKRDAIREGIDWYETGMTIWNLPRAGREGGAQLESDVLTALCNVYEKEPEWASRQVDSLMARKGIDRATAIKTFAGSDKIAVEVARLKAERAKARASQAGVSADDLLDGMDD